MGKFAQNLFLVFIDEFHQGRISLMQPVFKRTQVKIESGFWENLPKIIPFYCTPRMFPERNIAHQYCTPGVISSGTKKPFISERLDFISTAYCMKLELSS
ncbi:MAG: hypothetical protein ACYDEC_14655 [Bacteroidia bacterium]